MAEVVAEEDEDDEEEGAEKEEEEEEEDGAVDRVGSEGPWVSQFQVPSFPLKKKIRYYKLDVLESCVQ